MATLGALALYLTVTSSNTGSDGREIQWSELRDYVIHNRINRIQISPNRNVARVILHPNNRDKSMSSSSNNMINAPFPDDAQDDSSNINFGNNDINDINNSTSSSAGNSMSTSQMANIGDSILSSSNQHIRNRGEVCYITISNPEVCIYIYIYILDYNLFIHMYLFIYIKQFERKLDNLITSPSLNLPPEQHPNIQYIHETNMSDIVKAIYPIAIVGGLYFLMTRMAGGGMGSGGGGGGMGGIFRVGKSNAKRITSEDVNVTFADVAGCEEAKVEIMEFVSFLQNPDFFTKLGAKIPKGALLCGPPGTGKTLLAKAVAGEAGVPFYSISGSDFIEMFVGVGPARVRDLFKTARENAPCIIFIDEIDAVGRKRGKGNFSGGNDERENTLNQLLVEMDGFNTGMKEGNNSDTNTVVVLAGTNRPDILDQALTRPGRFDRQITVDKPDLKGRKQIFEVHLKSLTLSQELVDNDVSGRLAGLTPGFAGADIANICNEAAIVAARRRADAIDMQDFDKAVDRVIGGMESNKLISKSELRIVAHHEAGHAVAAWFLKHADPLLKVTIVPRSNGALGFAQYLPREMYLRSMDQILDTVCMALAGRAAEEVFFDGVTTGASDDLRKVTAMVYQTIQLYGMNDRIGQLSYAKDDPYESKAYSDATAQAMDEEAKRIVEEAYARTLELVTTHKEDVKKVAELLLEKETISHDDVLELVGERPFVDEEDSMYLEYVRSRKQPIPTPTQASSEMDDADADDNKTGELSPAGLV